MSTAPAKPLSRAATQPQVLVCAVLLATAASSYFLAREFTDWSPITALLVGFTIGAFVSFAAAIGLMILRYQLIRRGIPSFLTRDVELARDAFMARAEADRKELGLDKETRAFAERDMQELSRKLRELDLSPGYMSAGESERDRLMKELIDAHVKDTEARIHEEAARASERIEALRECRALEERARRGASLSFEEKERMKRLKATAYAGKLR
jgi:hypothetical protein